MESSVMSCAGTRRKDFYIFLVSDRLLCAFLACGLCRQHMDKSFAVSVCISGGWAASVGLKLKIWAC